MTPAPDSLPGETYEALASRLDVALLDPFASTDSVYEACVQAQALRVRAVVVRPCDCELVTQWLAGTGIRIASTAGFPGGPSTTGVKLYETRDVLRAGAAEVEFSLPVARLLARQFQHVEAELMQAAKACHESGAKLTVVYHSARLPEDLKIIATKICRRIEADTIAIDGAAAELAFFEPLLRDVLRVKLATPVSDLSEALAAREAGFVTAAVNDPGTVLEAWRTRLAEEEARRKTAHPAVS